MSGALLEIEGLTVEFPAASGALTPIEQVSFQIRKGETVCLVGESGSGKTITSKAIMRLIDFERGRIAAGSVKLDGAELSAMPHNELRLIRGKKVAMIFQEPMAAFDPVFTIGAQLVETIRRHDKRSVKDARAHATELLRRVGFPEPQLRMNQYPGELSGGMLQRAMIAMALACGPELLIADEPTTALDVTIQAQILRLLSDLKAELGMSILLITHDLGIAAEMADRMIVMYAGRIVEQAPAARLFAQPRHPYAAGLLRSITTMDSDRTAPLYTIEGAPPNVAEFPAGCRFHPRCPLASDKCRTDAPPLEGADGHEAACWHTDRLTGEAGAGLFAAHKPIQSAGAGLEGGSSGHPQRKQPQEASSSAAWNERQGGEEGGFAGDDARSDVGNVRGDAQGDIGNTGGHTGSDSLDSLGNTLTNTRHEAPLLFEVNGLTKHYPVKGAFGFTKAVIHAVDDVSFTVRQGETFGLVGESGSGKSTLGRVLIQLEQATSGRILFRGEELSRMDAAQRRAARRDMQMIFQDPYGSVNPRWTVGETIAEPFAVHERLSASERDTRVKELLGMVGLKPEWANRYPHEFSGGQRQRIGIARAIALRPRFVLADEAVSALDVSVQAQVVNLMQELQQRLGLTYVFIAHGLNIVRHVSSRIGVMYLGKLVEIAPADELFRHPAHHYTAALIASIPWPDPARKREFISIQGEIPSPASPPAGCRFHTRCPAATTRCREQEPQLIDVGGGHLAACHYPV